MDSSTRQKRCCGARAVRSASYGVGSGPQGYRPLREFLATKLQRDASIRCNSDEILIVSGSLQALDLVNGVLLARGDTVIIEQETYQGVLTRLERLGVNAVGIPLDREGMRIDALAEELAALVRRGIRPKYIYTIPRCRTRPARSCRRSAASNC
jgi:2-aminoadipate transaminase